MREPVTAPVDRSFRNCHPVVESSTLLSEEDKDKQYGLDLRHDERAEALTQFNAPPALSKMLVQANEDYRELKKILLKVLSQERLEEKIGTREGRWILWSTTKGGELIYKCSKCGYECLEKRVSCPKGCTDD